MDTPLPASTDLRQRGHVKSLARHGFRGPPSRGRALRSSEKSQALDYSLEKTQLEPGHPGAGGGVGPQGSVPRMGDEGQGLRSTKCHPPRQSQPGRDSAGDVIDDDVTGTDSARSVRG